ncbi:MAG: hypothetical protein DBY36_08220, partial [Clostridiales bacterium]
LRRRKSLGTVSGTKHGRRSDRPCFSYCGKLTPLQIESLSSFPVPLRVRLFPFAYFIPAHMVSCLLPALFAPVRHGADG